MEAFFNVELASKVGVKGAIIYAALMEYQKINPEKFFSYTIKEMQKNTTINETIQRYTINNLIKEGLIEMKLMELPATRHFKVLNFEYAD